MAAVDGLSALRAALMASRPVALQGDQLVIDGAAFPALGETAFHVKNLSGRRYKLLSLWLQYQMRERSFAEHMAFALQHKVTVADMVIVTDKLHVVEYLAGRSTAPDHVDTDKAASALGGGGASAAALALFDEPPSLELAMRREVQLRTRTTVLDVPGKANLRDFVFAKFEQQANARGGSASSAASVSSSASAVGSKRPRAAAAAAAAAAASMEAKLESFRGTPVIIVPATVTSLISLRNVAELLERGRFVAPADARAAAAVGGADAETRQPRVVDIRRRDASGVERVYHVIDDVALLKERVDWLRVVAVFAQGPDWQFKGWRWGRDDPSRPDITPTEIFDRCVGFHVMFEGDAPHPNVPKWNVKVLRISKTTRHSDAIAANAFWQAVDKDMSLRKTYIKPK